MTASKEVKRIWAFFANASGPEAVALYNDVTKILVARNLTNPPRVRKPKQESTDGRKD